MIAVIIVHTQQIFDLGDDQLEAAEAKSSQQVYTNCLSLHKPTCPIHT